MKPLTDKVDALFTEWDRPDSPGCAIGVIQNGKLVYTKGYGSANLEENISLTSRSVFYIASTSKQFTAASIVLLVHRGDLSLDDDIREYVPEIPVYERPITVRHLIHHTSGLRDYLDLLELTGKKETFSNEDAVEILSRQKALNFTPGEEHLYSNSGYILLAEIVKRVSGKSFREFAEDNIFQPLNMENTFFDDDISQVVDRVVSYRPNEEDGSFLSYTKSFTGVGDGGLLTTVEDLLLWDQSFYSHALGDGFVEQMLTRGKLNNGEQLHYAFGLGLGKQKGLSTVSHGGGMLGFRTEMLRFPEQRLTVVCLCNLGSMNPQMLAARIAALYLADLTDLAELEGDYYSEELRITWKLVMGESNLVLRQQGEPEFPLFQVDVDDFRVRGLSLKFRRDDQGSISGFALNTGRARGIHFAKTQ